MNQKCKTHLLNGMICIIKTDEKFQNDENHTDAAGIYALMAGHS